MGEMLRRLLPFVPPHLARKLIADPEWQEHVDSDRLDAAVLFADISGFTPLTESLAESGSEGPEELTRLLNAYFNPMIQTIDAESGEVVKFSGDALMVVFPAETRPLAEAIRRAHQAADTMQGMVDDIGALETSAGPVNLTMKIGIGAGEVIAMEIGGLLGRWEYVVAGDPILQATAAEGAAEPGQVILSPEAEARIYPEELAAKKVQTVMQPMMSAMDQVEKTMRRFVPGAVLGWLETSSRDWLGVLRPMTVLFIGMKDYEFGTDQALEDFHQLIRNIQRALYRFEGSLNKVVVDDKGTLVMALFGAPPLAHEDDAVRGVKASLEIRALAQKSGMEPAIGITTGQVFAGPVGNEMRYEYTVMGDSVNLAARLMKKAGPGGILCDQTTHRGASQAVRMEVLDPIQVKGKSKPVKVFRPDDTTLTSKIVSGSFRPPPMMAGRTAEARMIDQSIQGLRRGHCSVLLIEGGAGIGKTRLLKEAEMQAKIKGLQYFSGMGRATEEQVTLRAWRRIMEKFFELTSDLPDERGRQVLRTVEELAPGLLDQVSLLQDWLDLTPPEGTQELVLDQQQHEHSMIQLLKNLVIAWTYTRPLLLALDDAQWLDSLSWQLVLELCRAVQADDHPLMLLLSARPMDRGSAAADLLEEISAMDFCAVTQLQPLNRDDLELMIADRLGVLPEKVPRRLVLFIHSRSEGAPFVAEELLRLMQDQGMVEVWKDEKTNQNLCRVRGEFSTETETLPGAVRGMILSRIDRLTAAQQVTLKVAAVFGRRFSHNALVDVLGSEYEYDADTVREHLSNFHDMELIELESEEPDLVYRFQHQVTQEVAYDSMLFSQRRELHLAAARWFEQRFGDGVSFADTPVAELEPDTSRLTPYLSELARHHKASGNAEQELIYAVMAGRRALLLYQNDEAERYFRRVLEILPESDHAGRFRVLKDLESVHTLNARRKARKEALKELQQVAAATQDNGQKSEVAVLQAIYQFTYGRLGGAMKLAGSAIELARAAGDSALEGRARRWLGAAQQVSGHHQDARSELEQAMQLAQQGGDRAALADVTAQLARQAEKRGEFRICLDYCEKALELAREEGNLGNEAMILRRMASARLATGELDMSQQLAEKAEEIQRQIGDRRQEGVTLNLQGRIAVARGDYALGKAFFEKSLGLSQKIKDGKGQQRSLMLLGEACYHMGSYEKARICYEQALQDAAEMDLAYDLAEINTRMVLLEHAVGENEKARQFGLEAAKTLSKLNDPPLLAKNLTSLGHVFTELGEFDSAAAAYGNAIQIRQKLGQTNLLMETMAGSAQLDFKRGQFDSALDKVNEVIRGLGHQRWTSIEQPFRVYQTCFEVLENSEDPRATDIITKAHEELQQSAAAISDERLRDSFLHGVMEHRAVAYYYQGVQKLGST